MKLAERIFRRKDYTLTSKFGARTPITTKAGITQGFHNGTDYGTKGEKWPQFALEDGKVISCGLDTAVNGYAKFVWVEYPRLGIKLLHYHLDEIKVKKGQIVTKDTIVGTTGKTGKATGIHLHLGMKYLNKNVYVDPELYDYKEEVKDNFLPKKGYFALGDIDSKVGKIADFMYKTFPAYTSKKALGNLYGRNLRSSIIEFQKRTGLKPDGYLGEKTLKELKNHGFKC